MTKDITKLRALRVNRKTPLTLDDLAERIEYSKGHLSMVERGLIGASDDLIAKLARVHKLTVKEMRTICEGVYRRGRKAA